MAIGVWLICEWCGEVFLANRSPRPRRFCSKSCASKQKNASPEFRENASIRLSKLWKNLEHRDKMSRKARETMTRLHKDPEFARKQSEASSQYQKRKLQEPEHKEKMREIARQTMRRLRKDPEFARKGNIARILHLKQLRRDPQYKSPGVEAMLVRNCDPKIRENRIKRFLATNAETQGKPPRCQKLLFDALNTLFPGQFTWEYGVTYAKGKGSLYHLDIAHTESKTDIEVDGAYHRVSEQKDHDTLRQERLIDLGWNVIRVKNDEVDDDLESTVKGVVKLLRCFQRIRGMELSV